MSEIQTVLEYMPIAIRRLLENQIDKEGQVPICQIEEIRLRSNKPLSLKIGQDIYILEYIVKRVMSCVHFLGY